VKEKIEELNSIDINQLSSKLSSKIDEFTSLTAALRSEIENLKKVVLEKDQKIVELEKRILDSEKKTSTIIKDVHHLQIDSNRFKIRIYNFPNSNADYSTVKNNVEKFIQSFGIDSNAISDFKIFNMAKGNQIILSFISVDIVNRLLLKSRQIYKDQKIRIA
jgi:hypothetical protein